MSEAVSPTPFAIVVNRCHHRILGTREPCRHFFDRNKNGLVSKCTLHLSICRVMRQRRGWIKPLTWAGYPPLAAAEGAPEQDAKKCWPHCAAEGHYRTAAQSTGLKIQTDSVGKPSDRDPLTEKSILGAAILVWVAWLANLSPTPMSSWPFRVVSAVDPSHPYVRFMVAIIFGCC